MLPCWSAQFQFGFFASSRQSYRPYRDFFGLLGISDPARSVVACPTQRCGAVRVSAIYNSGNTRSARYRSGIFYYRNDSLLRACAKASGLVAGGRGDLLARQSPEKSAAVFGLVARACGPSNLAQRTFESQESLAWCQSCSDGVCHVRLATPSADRVSHAVAER